MAREKAIEMVKAAFDAWYSEFHTGDDWSEEFAARDMAIKALKQEPCEDVIRRLDVTECIKGYIHEIITESGIDKNAHTNKVLRGLVENIEQMPSVLPKAKTGKWLETEFGLKCSYCDKYTFLGRTERPIISDFCPNCGADMRTKAESEER